jgi:hypothetical protein
VVLKATAEANDSSLHASMEAVTEADNLSLQLSGGGT